MMQEGVGCGSPGDTRISGVGDVFVMKMYFTELGEYEMNNHVVEYEPDRRIGWEPEAGAGTPMPPRRLRSRPAGDSSGPLSSLPTARTRPP
jgi:hypothetical protein